MNIRHKTYTDSYDRIDLFLPSRLKEALKIYKEENGVDMTRIITRLLDMFFRGEIKFKDVPPSKINSYVRGK